MAELHKLEATQDVQLRQLQGYSILLATAMVGLGTLALVGLLFVGCCRPAFRRRHDTRDEKEPMVVTREPRLPVEGVAFASDLSDADGQDI